MVTAFIKHRVADYGMWKKAFDEHEEMRRKSGMLSHTLHRDADDPNVVVVAGHAPDAAHARDFLTSPDLRAAMESAGVEAPPEIWVTEDVEDKHY